jgi:nicotinamide-nucleotide adenylyltransferase
MRGFTIGRFQPFHAGHRRFVDRIADEVDELVVAIGSADASHELSNPFTAGERLLMLNKALAAIDVPTYVVPLEDIERNALWVAHVRSMCPPFDVAYSNNPLVVRLFEEAGVEVRSSPLYDRETLQGTELRRRMRVGESWAESVPDPVVEVIREIDGVERIRQVSASDGDTDGQNTPATDGGQVAAAAGDAQPHPPERSRPDGG